MVWVRTTVLPEVRRRLTLGCERQPALCLGDDFPDTKGAGSGARIGVERLDLRRRQGETVHAEIVDVPVEIRIARELRLADPIVRRVAQIDRA